MRRPTHRHCGSHHRQHRRLYCSGSAGPGSVEIQQLGTIKTTDHHSLVFSPADPDLCQLRPPHYIFAELKSQRGRVTADQRRWLDALRALSPTAPPHHGPARPR